ncbi:MAG TPA: hypothetical protein QF353_03310 [Gammaproteobacteria bacterium]|nr:hypothetical protein [Gammaproteobacteria bacterium]
MTAKSTASELNALREDLERFNRMPGSEGKFDPAKDVISEAEGGIHEIESKVAQDTPKNVKQYSVNMGLGSSSVEDGNEEGPRGG